MLQASTYIVQFLFQLMDELFLAHGYHVTQVVMALSLADVARSVLGVYEVHLSPPSFVSPSLPVLSSFPDLIFDFSLFHSRYVCLPFIKSTQMHHFQGNVGKQDPNATQTCRGYSAAIGI
jgi:hypothetical protein